MRWEIRKRSKIGNLKEWTESSSWFLECAACCVCLTNLSMAHKWTHFIIFSSDTVLPLEEWEPLGVVVVLTAATITERSQGGWYMRKQRGRELGWKMIWKRENRKRSGRWNKIAIMRRREGGITCCAHLFVLQNKYSKRKWQMFRIGFNWSPFV